MIATSSSLGLHRRRRRGRGYWTALQFLIGLAAVAAVGGYGYQVGVSASEAWADKLGADIERLQEDNLELRDALARTTLSASTVKIALADLQRRYQAEVPDGEVAALLEQVEDQLRAGVDPARLAFLIDAAGHAAGCAAAPETKRFRPRTPITTGPVSAIRFGDRITVTGRAQSALDADGQPEAWYDPAKPVQLVFQTLDGRALEVEGALPLRHQMLVDGLEYRFSAVAGPSSFVEVSGQACPFP